VRTIIFICEAVILGILTLLASFSGILVMLENKKSIISKAAVYLMILGGIPFLITARILSCFVNEEDKRIVHIVESNSLPVVQ
jgi:Na+-driven multidrug efflux pump